MYHVLIKIDVVDFFHMISWIKNENVVNFIYMISWIILTISFAVEVVSFLLLKISERYKQNEFLYLVFLFGMIGDSETIRESSQEQGSIEGICIITSMSFSLLMNVYAYKLLILFDDYLYELEYFLNNLGES